MYALINTFNGNRVISRHRTIDNAVKADIKFQRAVKRANGRDSYMPTDIVEIKRVAGCEVRCELPEDDREFMSAAYNHNYCP